jgi:hypothetical protein
MMGFDKIVECVLANILRVNTAGCGNYERSGKAHTQSAA